MAGVKADRCRNWPALGTVSEGWAAQASQLSVSGFSAELGHLGGKQPREQQALPSHQLLSVNTAQHRPRLPQLRTGRRKSTGLGRGQLPRQRASGR